MENKLKPTHEQQAQNETQYTTLQAVQEALQAYTELAHVGTIDTPTKFTNTNELYSTKIFLAPHEDDWQVESLNNRVGAMITHLKQTLQLPSFGYPRQGFYIPSRDRDSHPTLVTKLSVYDRTRLSEKLGEEEASRSLSRSATSPENARLLKQAGRPVINETTPTKHDLYRSIIVYVSPTQNFAQKYIQEYNQLLSKGNKNPPPPYSLDTLFIPQDKQYPY